MYLSGLEIIGFKSFPHKTTLEFSNGVTGIVGPNGCGKTNVLDAIRWVLGEQRISILRGGRMEDVIFSGTREVKPLGMSEVSLHIVNDRQVLPTEYSHLTVTRRLHRSGESEYLLNKVACRLKDIIELFADTGMGAHAYSAIELDMVETILSDKADQRRTLFEEAAGITKYKDRRRAALRKLEATDHDLLRLSDILSEVSTQVNSLSRQMKKAEKYKYLEDRVKTIGLVLLKESFRKYSLQLQHIRDEKRLSQIKLAELNGEVDRWELAREDYSSQSLEVSEELRALRVKFEEVSSMCYRLEREISVNEEKINSAGTASKNDLREVESIGIKIEQLVVEEQNLAAQLEKLRSTLISTRSDLTAQEEYLSEKLAALDQARRSSQIFQRDLFEIEGKRNLFEQSRQQLEKQRVELSSQIESEQAKRSELERLTEEGSRSVSEGEERLRGTTYEIDRLYGSLRDAESRKSELEESIDQTESRLAGLRLDLRSLEAEIELHERMITRYEGYGSGVTSIFAQRESLPGLHDTVANLISTEEGYSQAVELALGEAAEYVVVENRATADQAIEYLRENNLGRATFIIKSELESWQRDNKLARPGGFGGNIIRASEVVTAHAEHQKLVELLLGDVIVVNDQPSAEKLIDLGQGEFRVVTTDGHYYPARTLHQGGSDKPVALLGRESELNRLKEGAGNTRADLSNLEAEYSKLIESREELARRSIEITSELDESKRAQNQMQFDLTRLGMQKTQWEEQLAQISGEITRVNEKLSNCESQLSKLSDETSQLRDDSEGKTKSIEEHNAALQALESEVAQATHGQEELRLRVIRLQTEQSSLEGNLRRVEELGAELIIQRESKQAAEANRQQEIVELKATLENCHVELEKKAAERESLKDQEIHLVKRQSELSEKQSEFDQLLKALRKTRDQVLNSNQELLIRETEQNAKYEDIERQLHENFGVNASEMTLPEPLSDEAFADLESELTESHEKQAQLGLVNMLALEEYDKEAERERFLSQQINDLTKAKDDLKTTINRINATAKTMFIETFDKVKVNFQQVFSELFQGGEADLRMEDNADPLESPILISARPRGKRLLNISQLSGGEKALTAISLLFAIYLVKPSPFCILDEVDAPLDDANVSRFLRMIKTFSERTQFILITHNKRTMEQCDRLYGVTMQQMGISQIVSVDFESLGRPAGGESLKFVRGEEPGIETLESEVESSKNITTPPDDVISEEPLVAVEDEAADSVEES